jgi:hypothetical protein
VTGHYPRGWDFAGLLAGGYPAPSRLNRILEAIEIALWRYVYL